MNPVVDRLPIFGALIGLVVTLGAMWFLNLGGYVPIMDGILGASYLFSWVFIYGDGGDSMLQYCWHGLPFGLAFNIAVGSLAGWILRGILRLEKILEQRR